MPSQSPLISIIMAAKDVEPYLSDCLDSILAQTYSNWELIAVNDHSTDDTPNILRGYAAKDNRIKIFDSEGKRLNPALQTAYKNCTGELINRMDSDDKMPEDKLTLLVNGWNKYGKGYVIAGGTEHFVDEGEVGGGFIRYENWLNDVAKRSAHIEEIYKECVIPSHSWIIHREDFDNIGAFDFDVYPEDYDLCFRFYKGGLKIIGLDAVLHYWRDRENRISRTWEEYKDNRYFDLKIKYFYELDRDENRPLVLWGAGRNGKDMAKLLLEHEKNFYWVCDNKNKIGHDVYGIKLTHFDVVSTLESPQIIIIVAAPDGQKEIKEQLTVWKKQAKQDYWYFC